MRRFPAALAAVSTLAALSLLVACPSLSDIHVGSGLDASADRGLVHIPHDASKVDHHDATVVDAGPGDTGVDAACSTDLTADPANCGRCGHSCLGGSCVKGACLPVTLYQGHDTPTSVLVEDASVFVTVQTAVPSDSYVFRCTLPDCEATKTVIATGMVNPWFALRDGPRVLWVNSGDTDADLVTISGNVLECPPSGCPDGGPVGLLPDGGGVEGGATVNAIAVDSTFLYWVDIFGYGGVNTGGIYRCAKAECAGTLGPLVQGATFFPFVIAVDPTSDAGLFWTDIGTNQILRCSLPSCGGSPQIFSDQQLGASGLALHGGSVYWTVGDSPGPGDGGGILSCPTTGCGGTPTTIATGQPNPLFVAVDDGGIYWTNEASGGIMHCPLAGCATPTQIAQTPAAFWIALDDVSVYYTNSSSQGGVFRVAK